MDAEAERQLLERVKALEDQVARLSGEVREPETPEAATQRVIEVMNDIDEKSLQRVLRQMAKADWAPTFFGLPRKAIEKLKASVSKNAWGELVENWRLELYSKYRHAEHRQFLNLIRQLEEMGEIVLAVPEGFLDEKTRHPGMTAEEIATHFEKQRAYWAEETKRAAAEANRWLTEELGDLV